MGTIPLPLAAPRNIYAPGKPGVRLLTIVLVYGKLVRLVDIIFVYIE